MLQKYLIFFEVAEFQSRRVSKFVSTAKVLYLQAYKTTTNNNPMRKIEHIGIAVNSLETSNALFEK